MRLPSFASTLFATATLTSLALATPTAAEACTTYWTQTADGPVVAKSFDWDTADGWLVANDRGRAHTQLVAGGPSDIAAWTARYASVAFTTVGPGFPISGMNEAGLAIESLVDLSAARTTRPDPNRLTGLELVQYGLDRFDSAEALAAFARRVGYSQLGIPLHFFACDRTGACAVIESSASGATFKAGASPTGRILANRAYSDDAATLRPRMFNFGWPFGPSAPRAGSSEARFGTVARTLASHAPADRGAAFRLLDDVKVPGHTAWQIVWNLEHGTVQWKERGGAPEGATLRLADHLAECHDARAPRVRPIGSRAAATTFAAWSEADADTAERAVLAQLHAYGPDAHRLARAIAQATRSSACAAVE